jgi:hypothetical protein
MYEQSNSLLYIQKKQLAWLLAGIFVVIVSAITLSALLVNTLVKGQVASALNNQVVPAVQVLPAQAVTSSRRKCWRYWRGPIRRFTPQPAS